MNDGERGGVVTRHAGKKSSAAKFTPGPWCLGGRYGNAKTEICGRNNDRHVCAVLTYEIHRTETGKPTGRGEVEFAEGMANAHLIAAAPDMLAALETTLGNLRSLKGNAFRNVETLDVWISEVEAAVAKAKGSP